MERKMKKLILIIILAMCAGCATQLASTRECNQMKEYLFTDASCESGYRVPYMSGPAECMDMDDLQEIKKVCPDF